MSRALPLGAIVAQQKLRDDSDLKEFYLALLKHMGELSSSDRVFFARQKIDEFNSKITEDEFSCHKGCAHCCHHLISLASSEAKDFPKLNETQKETTDFQMQYLEFETEWRVVPNEFRRCVFLDENNACSIYQQRPLVCRSTFVTSKNENCDLIENKEIKPLYNTQANLVMLAFYTLEEGLPMAAILKDN